MLIQWSSGNYCQCNIGGWNLIFQSFKAKNVIPTVYCQPQKLSGLPPSVRGRSCVPGGCECPLWGAMCCLRWRGKCVLAAPVASPGPVWLCAASWAPHSSPESSWLHLPAWMWSFLPGIFAEEVEDHVQPPWKRVSDLAADPLLWEGGREVVVGELVSCSAYLLLYQKESS